MGSRAEASDFGGHGLDFKYVGRKGVRDRFCRVFRVSGQWACRVLDAGQKFADLVLV